MKSLPALNCSKQYINNTKIARVISSPQLTEKIDKTKENMTFEVVLQDNIINTVDIIRDPNITLSQDITPFDMAVMDAVYTIINSGQKILTVEWIARKLSENRNQKLSPQRRKAIEDSIDKLRRIMVRINAEEELKARKDIKNKDEKFVYESYLLPLDKIEARYECNGKDVIAYSVLRKPALYEYAEKVHQIIDIPAEYLETQKYYKDTEDAILIKRYVIKRVVQIKSSNRLISHRISFLWHEKDGSKRGLYAELGYVPDDSKKWRQTIKPMITKIVRNTLDSLKDKGVISWYSEYRADGTKNPASPVMGYEITVSPLRNNIRHAKEIDTTGYGNRPYTPGKNIRHARTEKSASNPVNTGDTETETLWV